MVQEIYFKDRVKTLFRIVTKMLKYARKKISRILLCKIMHLDHSNKFPAKLQNTLPLIYMSVTKKRVYCVMPRSIPTQVNVVDQSGRVFCSCSKFPS